MTITATPSLYAALLRIEKPGKTSKDVQMVYWICDNCSEHLYQPAHGQKKPQDYKYCPNCGARFR